MTLAQMRKRWDAIALEIHKLENAKQDKKNKALVGKCFKYRNGYNHNEKWWLYIKVTEVADGGVQVFNFERTSRDELNMRKHHHCLTLNKDYIPIKRDEFNRALRQFTGDVAALGNYYG